MDDVDFSSLSSVLQAVQDANAAGTVLPESFYNSAVQGLSSNPGGNPEYYLFSSDIENPQAAVVGDLYKDGTQRRFFRPQIFTRRLWSKIRFG